LLLIVATEEWTMRKTTKSPGEKIVRDIKRATRKHYSPEEKSNRAIGTACLTLGR
jgi:transposase